MAERIGIVGFGFVGKAIAASYEADVLVCDPLLNSISYCYCFSIQVCGKFIFGNESDICKSTK